VKDQDMTRSIAAFAIAVVTIASPGHAYLDGATASIALQALVGFFAAWGLYSRRATSWVKGLFKKEPASPAE
jgi:O-antigen/teichoic acid export membrane protein